MTDILDQTLFSFSQKVVLIIYYLLQEMAQKGALIFLIKALMY